jgi:hypothetical protein
MTEPKNSQKSKICDGSTSWDGILCHGCRQIFDHHVKRTISKRASDQQTTPEISSDPIVPLVDHRKWWHTMQSMAACAEKSCKLCNLVSIDVADKALKALESWNAALLVSLESDMEEKHTIYIWCPERDYGTISSDLDCSYFMKWRISISLIEVEAVEGELFCQSAVPQCS